MPREEITPRKLLLIQGPNLSYLGKREPEVYGTTTAAELDQLCTRHVAKRGARLDIFYTHHEGAAIERLYDAVNEGVEGLVMNPATFCLSGYGLAGCLRATRIPYIEVHLLNSNKVGVSSILAALAIGVIHGFGVHSYTLGLDAMLDHLERQIA